MDNSVKILLNSLKDIDSVNVENYEKVAFSTRNSNILEYNIRNVLSATEIFDAEREANPVYRIYGRIEYMSLLNGLKSNYTKFEDFFLPQKTGDFKSLLNSFKFYLVKPSTGYTKITNSSVQYIRYFEVIATHDQFELYPAGFSNNVYGEQIYGFNFNVDIDTSGFFDYFGFPVTELYLYAIYLPTGNETLKYTHFNFSNGVPSKIVLNTNILEIGDRIEGDKIEYSKQNYYQTQLEPQTYYVTTPVQYALEPNRNILWKYNPFTTLTLKYMSDSVYGANTGSTSYESTSTIPTHATNLGDGNFVWRDVLPQGYFDPLTGIGVDYPFINKRRYLFAPIVISIVPDLTDYPTTTDPFTMIWVGNDVQTDKTVPSGDINDIGKPC
jgi:hypothetical protein